MDERQQTFQSKDGSDLYLRALHPAQAPRAVLAMVHGLGEHSGRYDNLANTLVPRGYALYGFDLRGHGRSPGPRGHVASWQQVRDDVSSFLETVRAQQPEIPLFLFGHSLGGLIALNFALHEPDGLQGVIVSAPGLDSSGLSPVMLALARLLSRVAPKLALSSGLDAAGISRDAEVVRAYQRDPLVHDKGTPRLATEALAAVRWTLDHAAEWTLPLLLYYGTADPIVPPANSRLFFERVPFPDKTLIEYEGSFHEPHNDLDHARVLDDLERWLARHLG